jgi:hypothetical protein
MSRLHVGTAAHGIVLIVVGKILFMHLQVGPAMFVLPDSISSCTIQTNPVLVGFALPKTGFGGGARWFSVLLSRMPYKPWA